MPIQATLNTAKQFAAKQSRFERLLRKEVKRIRDTFKSKYPKCVFNDKNGFIDCGRTYSTTNTIADTIFADIAVRKLLCHYRYIAELSQKIYIGQYKIEIYYTRLNFYQNNVYWNIGTCKLNLNTNKTVKIRKQDAADLDESDLQWWQK